MIFRKQCSQKEEKIRTLRQRLTERDASKGGSALATSAVIGGLAATTLDASITPTTLGNNQGKGALIPIQPDHTTTSDFDSAIGGGISQYTRSSRASQSDIDFSEEYL